MRGELGEGLEEEAPEHCGRIVVVPASPHHHSGRPAHEAIFGWRRLEGVGGRGKRRGGR